MTKIRTSVLTPLEKDTLCLLLTGEFRPTEIIEILNVSRGGFIKSASILVEKGLINKRMVTNQGYPPPVYYSITERGKETLKKALKVDEFLEKFEKEEIETTHLLVLNRLIYLMFFERDKVNREEIEHEAIAILAGWLEIRDGDVIITKKGWRAIFKYLPTRQLQNLQILLKGINQVEVDEELKNYFANLSAISLITVEEIRAYLGNEEFESMVQERLGKIRGEIRRKIKERKS